MKGTITATRNGSTVLLSVQAGGSTITFDTDQGGLQKLISDLTVIEASGDDIAVIQSFDVAGADCEAQQ